MSINKPNLGASNNDKRPPVNNKQQSNSPLIKQDASSKKRNIEDETNAKKSEVIDYGYEDTNVDNHAPRVKRARRDAINIQSTSQLANQKEDIVGDINNLNIKKSAEK